MHVAYAGSPRKSSAKGVKAASFQQHPAAVAIAVITDKNETTLTSPQQPISVDMASNSQQELLERAARVEEAASKAVTLIEEFSKCDPSDESPSNPWRNPEGIFKRLDQARDDLQAAWQSIAEEKPQLEQKVIRAAMYIDLITDSFQDVLEELRTNEDVNVDTLADCLQSGLELLSSEEAELFLDPQDDDDDEEQLTPHEQRRRQLGFKQVQEAK